MNVSENRVARNSNMKHTGSGEISPNLAMTASTKSKAAAMGSTVKPPPPITMTPPPRQKRNQSPIHQRKAMLRHASVQFLQSIRDLLDGSDFMQQSGDFVATDEHSTATSSPIPGKKPRRRSSMEDMDDQLFRKSLDDLYKSVFELGALQDAFDENDSCGHLQFDDSDHQDNAPVDVKRQVLSQKSTADLFQQINAVTQHTSNTRRRHSRKESLDMLMSTFDTIWEQQSSEDATTAQAMHTELSVLRQILHDTNDNSESSNQSSEMVKLVHTPPHRPNESLHDILSSVTASPLSGDALRPSGHSRQSASVSPVKHRRAGEPVSSQQQRSKSSAGRTRRTSPRRRMIHAAPKSPTSVGSNGSSSSSSNLKATSAESSKPQPTKSGLASYLPVSMSPHERPNVPSQRTLEQDSSNSNSRKSSTSPIRQGLDRSDHSSIGHQRRQELEESIRSLNSSTTGASSTIKLSSIDESSHASAEPSRKAVDDEDDEPRKTMRRKVSPLKKRQQQAAASSPKTPPQQRKATQTATPRLVASPTQLSPSSHCSPSSTGILKASTGPASSGLRQPSLHASPVATTASPKSTTTTTSSSSRSAFKAAIDAGSDVAAPSKVERNHSVESSVISVQPKVTSRSMFESCVIDELDDVLAVNASWHSSHQAVEELISNDVPVKRRLVQRTYSNSSSGAENEPLPDRARRRKSRDVDEVASLQDNDDDDGVPAWRFVRTSSTSSSMMAVEHTVQSNVERRRDESPRLHMKKEKRDTSRERKAAKKAKKEAKKKSSSADRKKKKKKSSKTRSSSPLPKTAEAFLTKKSSRSQSPAKPKKSPHKMIKDAADEPRQRSKSRTKETAKPNACENAAEVEEALTNPMLQPIVEAPAAIALDQSINDTSSSTVTQSITNGKSTPGLILDERRDEVFQVKQAGRHSVHIESNGESKARIKSKVSQEISPIAAVEKQAKADLVAAVEKHWKQPRSPAHATEKASEGIPRPSTPIKRPARSLSPFKRSTKTGVLQSSEHTTKSGYSKVLPPSEESTRSQGLDMFTSQHAFNFSKSPHCQTAPTKKPGLLAAVRRALSPIKRSTAAAALSAESTRDEATMAYRRPCCGSSPTKRPIDALPASCTTQPVPVRSSVPFNRPLQTDRQQLRSMPNDCVVATRRSLSPAKRLSRIATQGASIAPAIRRSLSPGQRSFKTSTAPVSASTTRLSLSPSKRSSKPGTVIQSVVEARPRSTSVAESTARMPSTHSVRAKSEVRPRSRNATTGAHLTAHVHESDHGIDNSARTTKSGQPRKTRHRSTH